MRLYEWRKVLTRLLKRAERRLVVPELGKCLEWTGNVNSKGYGTTKVAGRTFYVHRLLYAIAFGYVPADKFVCHKCDNRRCMRPKHLFLGTAKQNHDDMVRKGRRWFPGKDPLEVEVIKVA